MNNHGMKSIGFIGIGVMGQHMAGHLLNAGYELHIYTRTQSKAQNLIDRGARWHRNASEVALHSDIIITMVGYPHEVEELYVSNEGIFAKARAGTYCIDMTTSSPTLAKQLFAQALEKQIHMLDAPVSGGDSGAQHATLSIMVGGKSEDFELMVPIFKKMGRIITYLGPAGSGQHTKMCNQIAIASTMIGVCEAIIYAKKTGLDPLKMITTLEAGAAASWSLSNLGRKILTDNFEPGFFVKLFIKDLSIALQSASELNCELPGLKLSYKLYKDLADLGFQDKATQALFALYLNQESRMNNHSVFEV